MANILFLHLFRQIPRTPSIRLWRIRVTLLICFQVPRHQWSGITAAPKKHSVCYWPMTGSGSVNAGANALPTAQLGGKDFFGYFLGHKKVTEFNF